MGLGSTKLPSKGSMHMSQNSASGIWWCSTYKLNCTSEGLFYSRSENFAQRNLWGDDIVHIQLQWSRSIYWAIPITVTNNPRVCSKITPCDTYQSTLMSPRYSDVTTSIRGSIIRYASNNFRFIIFNPTSRTSKSVPRFLSEKQGRKRAPTPMHRLPQCHLGNPRVECQNIHQVNQ